MTEQPTPLKPAEMPGRITKNAILRFIEAEESQMDPETFRIKGLQYMQAQHHVERWQRLRALVGLDRLTERDLTVRRAKNAAQMLRLMEEDLTTDPARLTGMRRESVRWQSALLALDEKDAEANQNS